MEPKVRLKRDLGLFEATTYGVGIILGAGIYVLIGEAAEMGGNAMWISFLIAALLALFTGLSYCELSSMFPKESAEYVYTKRAFKSGFLSFLIGWVVLVSGIVAAATVALGFAGYFAQLFGGELVPIAVLLILILSLLNFWGIKESARFNVVFTLTEAAGLVLIIILGIPYLGSVNYLTTPQGILPMGISGLLAASALIFFAYIGFEDMANIAEETKGARKTIPKALIYSVLISTILYILVAISSVSVIPWEALASSSAPLVSVAAQAIGPGAGILMSMIALFATMNTVLITLIVGSRMLYGMASESSLPGAISRIHGKRRTPWISILIIMAFTMLAATIGDIKTVASITDVSVFIAFIFVNLSLIWLRFREPGIRRPFRMPLNIGKFPVLAFLGFLISLFMIFYIEPVFIMYEMAVILIGLAFYGVLRIRTGL